MGYAVIRSDELEWATRTAEPGEPQRHVAGLTDRAGFTHTRANLWRYEPGAKGRRHRDMLQEETFVVVRGTLTMYLGEPPERHEVGAGGLVHVRPETPLQGNAFDALGSRQLRSEYLDLGQRAAQRALAEAGADVRNHRKAEVREGARP